MHMQPAYNHVTHLMSCSAVQWEQAAGAAGQSPAQPLLYAFFGALLVVIGLCLLEMLPLTVTCSTVTGRVGFGLQQRSV